MTQFEITNLCNHLKLHGVEVTTPPEYFQGFPDVDIDELLAKLKRDGTKKATAKQLVKIAYELRKKSGAKKQFCSKCDEGVIRVLDFDRYDGKGCYNWAEVLTKYSKLIACKCQYEQVFSDYITRMESKGGKEYELAWMFLFNHVYYTKNVPVKIETFNISNYFGIRPLQNCKSLKYHRFNDFIFDGVIPEIDMNVVTKI